jgi:hypothetical protein
MAKLWIAFTNLALLETLDITDHEICRTIETPLSLESKSKTNNNTENNSLNIRPPTVPEHRHCPSCVRTAGNPLSLRLRQGKRPCTQISPDITVGHKRES